MKISHLICEIVQKENFQSDWRVHQWKTDAFYSYTAYPQHNSTTQLFTIGKIDSILWLNTLNIHNFAIHPLIPTYLPLSSTCLLQFHLFFLSAHKNKNEMKHKQLCWDEISLVMPSHRCCFCCCIWHMFANRKSNFSASLSLSLTRVVVFWWKPITEKRWEWDKQGKVNSTNTAPAAVADSV